MALKDRILELLTSTPGLTDREMTDRLLGHATHPAAVNQAARQLGYAGRLERRTRHDGCIGNYATATGGAPTSVTPPAAHARGTQMGMVDIDANLRAFLAERTPGARYTSFDYCFNYFQSHREQHRLDHLLRDEGLQLSCLHLGFYLASWGMFRGSADLLQRSVRHFIPVIEAIASAPVGIWEVDANSYGDGDCPLVFETAGRIRKALANNASDILVTKIMLGTFGCVPAFDTYFKNGFGVAKFGRKALRRIGEYYVENREVIEWNRVACLEFNLGAPTERRYTRAKVIDMIFFVEGGPA